MKNPKALPTWLVEKLNSIPEAGTGIHAWLYATARQLHAHMTPEEAVLRLRIASMRATRRVTDREIADAVRNSRETAWKPREEDDDAEGEPATAGHAPAIPTAQPVVERWPGMSLLARECALKDGCREIAGQADLWESSPVRPDGMDADAFLDALFPGDPWLCLAQGHPGKAKTRRRHEWEFVASDHTLIVPSPMTKALGARKDGRPSVRCLGNTGPRRFLVVEFDDHDGQDVHATLLWHLHRGSLVAGGPRLALAVHSGGKSLHGWFRVDGQDEAELRSWFSYSVLLGGDPHTFTRCQFVRLPAGQRESGEPQIVLYFDPALCTR